MKFGGFGLGLLLQIGLDFSPDPQSSILISIAPPPDAIASTIPQSSPSVSGGFGPELLLHSIVIDDP